MPTSKTCTKCGVEKSLDEFGPRPRGKYGRKAQCKDCMNARARELYDPVKEQAKRDAYKQTDKGYFTHRKAAWRRHGILDVDTLDWEKFIESQSSKCFVCSAPITPKSAHRDHDHKTGLTRAAVCSTMCNIAMDLISDGLVEIVES